jgi:hypothetical protein
MSELKRTFRTSGLTDTIDIPDSLFKHQSIYDKDIVLIDDLLLIKFNIFKEIKDKKDDTINDHNIFFTCPYCNKCKNSNSSYLDINFILEHFREEHKDNIIVIKKIEVIEELNIINIYYLRKYKIEYKKKKFGNVNVSNI